MQNAPAQQNLEMPPRKWSNRILIAGTLGILFLTLFPFRLLSHPQLSPGAFPPMLSVGLGKRSGAFDAFLNVLLFVPFGFGLSERLRGKGKSRGATLAFVWIAGVLFSYSIEFTQLYIPGRDSGWEDVLTNSTGSAVGFFLFSLSGSAVVKCLGRTEEILEPLVTPRRVALILFTYFVCWFAISAHLQGETKLTNWDPDSRLVVGNGPAGKPGTAWKGEISLLEIWNRGFTPEAARALTANTSPDAAAPDALAAYDFAGGPPFSDRMKSLPNLSWSTSTDAKGDPNQLIFDGSDWLVSTTSVARLVAGLQRTNQFAIHLICKPAEGNGWDSQIMTISGPSGIVNLIVRQQDADLVLWFRSPLVTRYNQLAWHIPNTLLPDQRRNILYSYDGTSASLYVDGRRAAPPYWLGPGAGLARSFRRIKTNELEGYHDIYYGLVFFPAGALLGIAMRNVHARNAAAWLLFAILLVVPPLLLERLLMAVSGRPFSPGHLALSLALAAGGALWMNADAASHAR